MTGTSNCFLVPCPDERIDELIEKLEKYRDGCKYDKRIRVVALNVDKVF